MPEALAIVAVFVVTVIAFIGAWVQERNPAPQESRVKVEHLQNQLAWLDQRMVMARQENWDERMIDAIAAERAATLRRLAETDVGRAA